MIRPVTRLIVIAWLTRKIQEIESNTLDASIRRRRVVEVFIDDAGVAGGVMCMGVDLEVLDVLVNADRHGSEQGTKALSEEHMALSTPASTC